MTFIFFYSMYNKSIIRFSFCDIQNNQGRGRGYQPKPKAEADDPYRGLPFYYTFNEKKMEVMFLLLHRRQATQSART